MTVLKGVTLVIISCTPNKAHPQNKSVRMLPPFINMKHRRKENGTQDRLRDGYI